jgi:hypothetical protein
MNSILSIFQFAIGCHHRRLSSVFTIKKRTYQVCLKCGQEFEYSWALMQAIRSSAAAAPQVPR